MHSQDEEVVAKTENINHYIAVLSVTKAGKVMSEVRGVAFKVSGMLSLI